MGWRVPTSYTANTNQWNNPANCYDGDLETYGYDDIYPLPFTGYYIEFNISEIQCNKIRFNAGNNNGKADKIDIDVYYNGSWHSVYYRGYFSSHVWVEASLGGTYQVTKARVRFLASQIWLGGQGWLYEFNFYEIVTETGWVNEPYAYDDNTGSEAYCVTPKQSWTPWLVRELSEAVYSATVKFYAQYDGVAGIKFIDLNVYYDGAWHDVFEGSYMNKVWVEKALGDTYYVSKIAVRFFNASSATVTAFIQEMQFIESAGIPKLTTNAATAVADGKATLNGNITSTGGVTCTIRGFKYKEGISGEEQDTSDSGYFAVGEYSKDLTGLDPTKKYYFKAYATNTAGTGYGDWKSFGEDIAIPTVTTSAATSVDHEKAVLNGNITETGGEDPEERGFEYKIGAETTILTIRETGSFGVGAYSLDFDGLDPNVEYHFRAYAKNGGGTAYGDWLDFTTDYTTPMVKTHNATNELETQVTGNGEIVSTGGKDCFERGFDYGLSKMATWEKKEAEGGYGIGFFDITIDGLVANTEYWYRAYAQFLLKSSDVQITTSSFEKWNPQFQIVGNKVYYVWSEIDAGDKHQIWTAISDLDSSNFTATKRTDTAFNKRYPQLQVSGEKIYYVWEENSLEIWTAIMDLDQTNWVATKRETNTETTKTPQLQVVDSTIYYVWIESDGSHYQIWTATMTIAGADWTAVKRTTTNFGKEEAQFQVTTDTIYFVWKEIQSTPTYWQIWTATMTIAGADFTATKRTTDNGHKVSPQLQVVGDYIYFVFTGQPSDPIKLFTAIMNINGTGWSATQRTNFTDNAQHVQDPQLQVVENRIYYVFTKYDYYGKNQLYSAVMDINQTNFLLTEETIRGTNKNDSQLQVYGGVIYYVWSEEASSYYQIWSFENNWIIGYGEWVKFITAAPGLPGDRPSGYKNDICSDDSGFSYILNRSLTDDGAVYKSHFVLSTDLSGKKTLHTNKRLEDIFSYFANKGTGTAKIYVKRDNEPVWQEAGEISLAGEEEIIIKHLAPDFLAKTYLIKFVFENDFEFIGAIFESIPIGDRP